MTTLSSLQPEIKTIPSKKLIGLHLRMSLVNNRTGQLWGAFMPHRSQIVNALSKDLYSLQVYDPGHFEQFNPAHEFEKWALVEVSSFETVPEGMESFELPGGQYAVFLYKGLSTDPAIFRHIFQTWLPSSGYRLDDRPHFEVLGDKYKNNDPESEEEIWIPVQKQ